MDKIVVLYGNGEAKKGSVRMKPLEASTDIDVANLGDFYISRSILNALGVKDKQQVKVTFEKAWSEAESPLI